MASRGRRGFRPVPSRGWTVAHPPIVAVRTVCEDSASLEGGFPGDALSWAGQRIGRWTFSFSEAPGVASAIHGPSPDGSTMPSSSHS